MKKTLLTLLAALAITASLQAQDDNDEMRVKIGIKGGYNYANMSINTSGDIEDKNAISTFNVGAYVDLPIAPVLSLQGGLMFTGKGAKFTYGDKSGGNWYELTTNPLYLELPVNLVGKIPLGPKVKLLVGAGVYGAMGVAGKYKVNGEVLGFDYSKEESITFSNDDPTDGDNGESGNLKKFDFGLNFLAGLEISHFTINANYGLGMVNVKPGENNDDNDKYKNRVFSVSVGVLF